MMAPFLFGLIILFTGVFVGEQWGLYDRIPRLDDLLHLAGGIAVAWAFASLLRAELAGLPKHVRILFIVAVTCLVGVVWEFAEYASNATRYSAPWWYRYLHGGDLADTIRDLAADIVGGLAVAIAITRAPRSGSPKAPSRA